MTTNNLYVDTSKIFKYGNVWVRFTSYSTQGHMNPSTTFYRND